VANVPVKEGDTVIDGTVNSLTASTVALAYLEVPLVEAVTVKLGSIVLAMSLAVTVTGMVHTSAVLPGRAIAAGLYAVPLAISSLQSEMVMFVGGKLARLLVNFRLEFASSCVAPLMSITV
jgi:hypothetical protein